MKFSRSINKFPGNFQRWFPGSPGGVDTKVIVFIYQTSHPVLFHYRQFYTLTAKMLPAVRLKMRQLKDACQKWVTDLLDIEQFTNTRGNKVAETLTCFHVHRSSVADDETVLLRHRRQVKVCLLELHLHPQRVLVELCYYTNHNIYYYYYY